MSIYPEKIAKLISRDHARTINDCNGEGRAVSFDCGSLINIQIAVEKTKVISGIAFSSNGCGYMTATAQSLADVFRGLNLKDLHGTESEEIFGLIQRKTGEFPATRRQCAATAVEAFRKAIVDYRERMIAEFHGEIALICSCFGVHEDRINDVIAKVSARDVKDVSQACNAASGCGSCRMLIQEMIDVYLSEQSG